MKTIHHVVDVDADALVVWAALTEPDRMAGWWSTRVEAPPVTAVGTHTAWTFDGDFNPVMETVALSVAVRVWLPAVLKVRFRVLVPFTNGAFAGRIAFVSVAETATVCVIPLMRLK